MEKMHFIQFPSRLRFLYYAVCGYWLSVFFSFFFRFPLFFCVTSTLKNARKVKIRRTLHRIHFICIELCNEINSSCECVFSRKGKKANSWTTLQIRRLHSSHVHVWSYFQSDRHSLSATERQTNIANARAQKNGDSIEFNAQLHMFADSPP